MKYKYVLNMNLGLGLESKGTGPERCDVLVQA